jgi:starch-binding outer membrane protein, SusD/RagB family
MKKYRLVITFCMMAVMSVVMSCKEFLETTPYGVVTAGALDTPAKAEDLVIAAYAGLGNSTWSGPYTSDWVWGSVRSDDAYKGGSGVADQANIHNLEVYNLVQASIAGYQGTVWIYVYQAISRVNNVLRQLDKFSDAEYVVSGLPNARVVRQAEMRFLRGHFMFILKKLFKYPVWIEHTATQEEIKLIDNKQFTNDQLWDKIAADFQFAYDNLPVTQSQKGRANKMMAAAYLAKTRLYQAYTQDEQHNVIGINATKLQEVVTMADVVINSGRYSLVDNYGKKWTWGNENNSESIFAVQYSYDDGTAWGRVDFEHGLNYNMASVYGCCSFHHASQNLVNAFRTDQTTGLPLFNTFNQGEMKNPADFQAPANSVDPRLDHTVGIPSHPFKYDVNFVAQNSWSRTPAVYGNFLPMKEIQLNSCNCIRKGGAFFGTAMNWDVIQYNDLLLMKAEALIELGQHAAAMPIINQIRQRAANSTAWLTYPAGHAQAGKGYSNYKISLYDGVNLPWTQDNARQALRWERRLEFAMESPRFHDLVRWGIAAETLNAYIAVEKTRGHSYMNTAVFTKGRDEYVPIPQDQINLVDGLYTQNPGY